MHYVLNHVVYEFDMFFFVIESDSPAPFAT